MEKRVFSLQIRHGPMITRPMLRRFFFSAVLMTATAAAAESGSLGVFGQWAGFERQSPHTCYAIAAPYRAPRSLAWKPFASVSYWPARRVRAQLHFRLSREKRVGSAVLLRIDDRIFQLLGGKTDAWAVDAAADAEIVAAMRTGVEMRIETRTANGALVRDSYWLRGAATAIDAAAIACSR